MTPKSPELGLYLHVPFCHARCGYCDFVTFTGKEDRIDRYVSDLCQEIVMMSSPAAAPLPSSPAASGGGTIDDGPPTGAFGGDGFKVSTIFFGGGTPSLLDPHHVSKILSSVRSHFTLAPDPEITMEANPESTNLKKARGWKEAGVNRLSIGLQAFDNDLLRAAGRLHTVEDFVAAFRAARKAGFKNLNVDLIYGLPGQTLAAWRETLARTVAMRPEHLSLYALQVEDHTPFHTRGVVTDQDLQADMYEWARVYLNEAGYPQYEISNFARPGRECRHNLIYWRQGDYLGCGVGAVGCANGLRWENHKNLPDYECDICAGKLPRASTEILGAETRRFERLMLGLRLREGLAWVDDNPEWLASRSMLQEKGLLEEVDPPDDGRTPALWRPWPCLPAGRRWRIPDSAVALTNQILLPFI